MIGDSFWSDDESSERKKTANAPLPVGPRAIDPALWNAAFAASFVADVRASLTQPITHWGTPEERVNEAIGAARKSVDLHVRIANEAVRAMHPPVAVRKARTG